MLRITRSSKEAKLQWLQDPNEINGENLNSARDEGSRHLRDIKRITERRN
jgi:hypothetical protein